MGSFWDKPDPETAEEMLERRKVPEQKVRDELKEVKVRVESILRNFPQTRESDTYLDWKYATTFGGLKYLDYEEFTKLLKLNFGTIERARRLIQHDEQRPLATRYLPRNPEILRKRRVREEIIRVLMASGTV